MREIKFRGLDSSNNWRYGAYFSMHHNDSRDHVHHFIIPDNTPIPRDAKIGDIQVEVTEKSVGQFTGFCDCEGICLFEGDIVSWNSEFGRKVGYIAFHQQSGEFKIVAKGCEIHIGNRGIPDNQLRWIGDIYHNPELITWVNLN